MTENETVMFQEFSVRLRKIRIMMKVDTQKIRRRLIIRLQEIFDLASEEMKGSDESSSEWARVAAYTAQVIEGISRGYDERQTAIDLDRLEAMLKEVQDHQKTQKEKETSVGAAKPGPQ